MTKHATMHFCFNKQLWFDNHYFYTAETLSNRSSHKKKQRKKQRNDNTSNNNDVTTTNTTTTNNKDIGRSYIILSQTVTTLLLKQYSAVDYAQYQIQNNKNQQ